MNHRFGDGAWPQGESEEIGREDTAVPATARATPEQLSLWLRADAGAGRAGDPQGPAAAVARRRASAGGHAAEVDPQRRHGDARPGRWSTRRAAERPRSSATRIRRWPRSTACTRASAAAGPGSCSPTASPSACCCSACPASGCGRADAARSDMVLSVLGAVDRWCCGRAGAGAVLSQRARDVARRRRGPLRRTRTSSSSPPPSITCRRRRRLRLRASRCRPPPAAAARSRRRSAPRREQVHDPGRRRVGEDHHRPDQRPVPQLRVAPRSRRHIRLKSWVGPSISSPATARSPAKRRRSCGGCSSCTSPSSKRRRRPLPRQQHQFAIDAGKRRERRVAFDLGDRQAPVPGPASLPGRARDLARPAGSRCASVRGGIRWRG